MKENCLYVLQHINSGLIKIGVTGNWKSRSSQLCVGSKCNAIMVVACEDNYHEESKLHCDYDQQRIPQTEWFELSNKQIETLLKRVAMLGEQIEWRPKDVKPKPKRQPRKPTPTYTEDQLRHWEARLIELPFVSVVDVYADAVVFYGLELQYYWDEWHLMVIGAIGFNRSGVTKYEYGFRYGQYHCLDKTIKYEDEKEFFEDLSFAARKAYESNSNRILMKPGTKIERPTGEPLDWWGRGKSHVDLGRYLSQAS